MANHLEDLKKQLSLFAKAREWEKFHIPRNLVMAICGEAGELAAEFQWLRDEEATALSDSNNPKRQAVVDEMADVFIYLVRLADILEVDLIEASRSKIRRNEARFPPGANGPEPSTTLDFDYPS